MDPIKVRRLNHAVLFVSDLARAEAFYTDVLGMSVISRIPGASAAFLRAAGSSNHHDLGLFGVGPDAVRPPRGNIGLYHLAWEVESIHDLQHAREALRAAGAYTGESDHGASKSLYGADPDGNEFEVMFLVPRDDWGPDPDAAPIRPLDLDAEVERYG
ncbi:MAG: VOC family protein [Nocardioidaceae bacterium]